MKLSVCVYKPYYLSFDALLFQAGFADVHVVDEVNLVTVHQTTLYMQLVS
jgi:hypothetical protein